jgi:hypothetical protein
VEDIVAIVLIFGGLTAFLLAISPIGRAVADRIRRGGNGPSRESLQRIEESYLAVLEEMESLRQELTDVQGRIDFAERLLARQPAAERLPPAVEDGGSGTA